MPTQREQVVTAGGGDFERRLGALLALDAGEIDLAPTPLKAVGVMEMGA